MPPISSTNKPAIHDHLVDIEFSTFYVLRDLQLNLLALKNIEKQLLTQLEQGAH